MREKMRLLHYIHNNTPILDIPPQGRRIMKTKGGFLSTFETTRLVDLLHVGDGARSWRLFMLKNPVMLNILRRLGV